MIDIASIEAMFAGWPKWALDLAGIASLVAYACVMWRLLTPRSRA